MHGSQREGARTVKTLAADVREEMARLGYSQDTQRHYQATWSRLAAFALERKSEGVSVELAEAFLVHSGVGSTDPGAPAASTQCHLRAAMRFLLEFQMHGCFQRRRSSARFGLPGEFARIMSEYEQFCTHELGIKHRTMRGRRRNVVRLLMHHASRKSTDVRTIGVETVSDFLKSWCHLRPQTLALVVCDLRSLAGIELPRACRKGLHALRHTVATRLLEAGVSLDAISGVMGHVSPETTRLYTKVDIPALRSAALTLEEVEYAYLRLTPSLFPEVAASVEALVGHVVPRRELS
jgi:integrase